jgi:drug/metabolite transporter (DMT)-like permease
MGREINRSGQLTPALVTAVSMGIGGLTLLVGGAAVQGVPALSPTSWLIILWLAAVNTAFAFTLWNHTLRTLSALESSIINNTMLIQIALLAWLFLGETIRVPQGIGMAIAAAGILIVQLRRSRPISLDEP